MAGIILPTFKTIISRASQEAFTSFQVWVSILCVKTRCTYWEFSTIYIATKDCHLVLLSNLTKDTANNNALLQLDLISRILCLRDCATSSSNCGQVGETAMIVDFRIEKQSWGYVKADILDKFYEGNGEFHSSGLMATAVKTPHAVKMDIMKKSLQQWKLLESIEWAESEI